MATRREPKPIFDRTPPQNIDAERSVLGAMLLNADAVGAAVEVLRDSAGALFYVEAHQHIYAAMIALFQKNAPVDEITLTEQVRRDGHLETCGGAAYIAELTTVVPTSANAEYYAKIVLDAAILRKLITVCTQVTGLAYAAEGEVNELLDHAEASIFSIAEAREVNPIWRIRDLIPASVEQIDRLTKAHSGITGLATGYAKLDEMLSGLQPSDMIILAARPSVGKTALALNIASHAAVHNKKGVLMFSLEMSKEQLTQRLLCMEGRIDSRRLRSGFLAAGEMSKLIPAAGRLEPAPLYIDDTPNITMLEVRSKSRRHVAQHEVSLVIIDYLQLMSSSRRTENRQVEIAEISRSVKGLARELRIPVIAISQLSREAEKDDTGVPKLSHLRESGALEQDADVVLILSRPPKHEAEEKSDIIKVQIAKQRNGPTGEIELLFLKNVQRFENVLDGTEDGPARTSRASKAPDEPPLDEEMGDDDEAPF